MRQQTGSAEFAAGPQATTVKQRFKIIMELFMYGAWDVHDEVHGSI